MQPRCVKITVKKPSTPRTDLTQNRAEVDIDPQLLLQASQGSEGWVATGSW